MPAGSDQIEGSFYESDPMYAPLFQEGRALPVGSKYPRLEFARTLKLLAEGGAEAFYEGEVADAVIKVIRDRGGLISLDDLKGEFCLTAGSSELKDRCTRSMGRPYSSEIQRLYPLDITGSCVRCDMAIGYGYARSFDTRRRAERVGPAPSC